MSFAHISPIKRTSVGSCYLSATLDPRNTKREGDIPRQVVITFHLTGDSNTFYYRLAHKLTRSEYLEVQRATGRGRAKNDEQSPFVIKRKIEEEFDEIVERLRKVAKSENLNKEVLKAFLNAKATQSFTEFWAEFNQTKSPGTKASYDEALVSFKKYVGDTSRSFINADDIHRWERGMANDGHSLATIGIYERSCKAAWNAAVRNGLAERKDYPFGRIPRGSARKKDWLDVDTMTELYHTFCDQRYPDKWSEIRRRNVHRALGLFLFQYLANGCNLTDVAELCYDDSYYNSEGSMLTFVRQKTAERSDQEVVIPVIKPLLKIIEELGGAPEKGRRVIPFILDGATDIEIKRKIVAQVNKNVREGLNLLTQSLGLNVKPGGMWARHSFATNLTHAGVPERYISEAMGHAVNTVTSRYIDAFPLHLQVEYNSKLLNLDESSSTADETVTISSAEYQRLLQIAASQQPPKK